MASTIDDRGQVSPHWNVLDISQTVSLINEDGLAGDYARLLVGAEQSYVLDRDILRKLSSATGARFVFQPRLAYFSQEFEDRWSVPVFNVRAVQTRQSTLRVSLSLWDASTGALLWSSVAEANLQSEALTQDPVFFEDAARVALASMLSDLLNRKTKSVYTPYDVIIDRLMWKAMPSKSDSEKTGGEQGDAGT